MGEHGTNRDAPLGIVATNIMRGTPVGLGLDEGRGHIYIACNIRTGQTGFGRIYTLDLYTGTTVDYHDVGINLKAIAVDEATGHIFLADGGPEDANGMPLELGRVLMLGSDIHMIKSSSRVGAAPSKIVPCSLLRHVFVAVYGYDVTSGQSTGNTLYMLDLDSGALLASISAGFDPIAISADDVLERVYVTNIVRGGSAVTVDARSGRIVHEAGVGNTPSSITVYRDKQMVFVTNSFSDSLSVLDAVEGVLVGQLSVAKRPLYSAVAPSSGKLFVLSDAMHSPGAHPSVVTIVDVGASDVLSARPFQFSIQGILRTIQINEDAGIMCSLNVKDKSLVIIDLDSIHPSNPTNAISTHEVGIAAMPIEARVLGALRNVIVLGRNSQDSVLVLVKLKG